MASFRITGASRGFGLAFTHQLLSSEAGIIFATARSPSPALEHLANQSSGQLIIVKMKVTDEASIRQAVHEVESELGQKGLDVLVNNAGIAQYTNDGVKSMDNLQESFFVNVMGTHWVTRPFLPLRQKGQSKKIVNISTTFGSTTLAPYTHLMPAPAYKISKAAMNALTVQYALDLGKDGFSVMVVASGWMKTELGGGDMADLTPEQGAKATLDIIFKPNAETTGTFPKVFVEGWEKSQNAYDGSNAPR